MVLVGPSGALVAAPLHTAQGARWPTAAFSSISSKLMGRRGVATPQKKFISRYLEPKYFGSRYLSMIRGRLYKNVVSLVNHD